MSEILKTAADIFAGRAWDATPYPRYPDTLAIQFDTGRAKWRSYAQAKGRDRVFVFYSVSPENVPPERRQAAREYLERVNWGLLIGNFEMDPEDGEVRFKTSVDLHGEPPAAPLLAGAIEANLDAINRYLPGLLAVTRGEATPAEAFAEAEE